MHIHTLRIAITITLVITKYNYGVLRGLQGRAGFRSSWWAAQRDPSPRSQI